MKRTVCDICGVDTTSGNMLFKSDICLDNSYYAVQIKVAPTREEIDSCDVCKDCLVKITKKAIND